MWFIGNVWLILQKSKNWLSVAFSLLRIKKKKSLLRSKYSLITTTNGKYEKENYFLDLQKTGELMQTEVKLAYL